MKHTKCVKDILLSATAGISIVAPIATLATACGADTRKQTPYGDEFDKEYNISEASYQATKNALWSQRKKQIEDQLKEEGIVDSVEIARRVQEEHSMTLSTFQSFDSKKSEMNLGNALSCYALSQFASKTYRINLIKTSSVTWPDVENVFNNSIPSIKIFLENSGVHPDQIENVIAVARGEFEELVYGSKEKGLEGLKDKYNDPLFAILEARNSLVNLFSDVNDFCAKISAQNRLKEFLNGYMIEYKSIKGDYSNTFDKVKDDLQRVLESPDKVIDSTLMNKIFSFKKVSMGETTDVNFDQNILAGYTLKPRLLYMSENVYENKYSVNIDFSLYKNSVALKKNGQDLERVTAHIYNPETSDKLEVKTQEDYFKMFSNESISGITYDIPLSPEAESEALYDAYFNPNKLNETQNDEQKSDIRDKQVITLGWDKNDSQNGYAPFFAGELLNKSKNANGDDVEEYLVDLGAVIDSGAIATVMQTNDSSNEKVEKRIKLSESFLSSILDLNDESKGKEIPEILDSLFQNCEIKVKVKVVDEKNKIFDADMFATYLNSSYVDGEVDDENKCISNFGHQNSFTIDEPGKNGYFQLVQKWNLLNKRIEDAEKDQLKDEKTWIIVDGVFNTLAAGIALATGIYAGIQFFIAPFSAPVIGVILTLTGLSLACQGIEYWLFVQYELLPYLNYKKQLDNLRNLKEIKVVKDDLAKAKKTYLIPLANDKNIIKKEELQSGYDSFKKLGWNEIKKALNLVGSYEQSSNYINFNKAMKENGADTKPYTDSQKGWMPGQKWFNLTISLDFLSIDLDGIASFVAASAPQLVIPVEMLSELDEANQKKNFAKFSAKYKLIQKLRQINKAKNLDNNPLVGSYRGSKVLFKTAEQKKILEMYDEIRNFKEKLNEWGFIQPGPGGDALVNQSYIPYKIHSKLWGTTKIEERMEEFLPKFKSTMEAFRLQKKDPGPNYLYYIIFGTEKEDKKFGLVKNAIMQDYFAVNHAANFEDSLDSLVQFGKNVSNSVSAPDIIEELKYVARRDTTDSCFAKLVKDFVNKTDDILTRLEPTVATANVRGAIRELTDIASSPLTRKSLGETFEKMSVIRNQLPSIMNVAPDTLFNMEKTTWELNKILSHPALKNVDLYEAFNELALTLQREIFGGLHYSSRTLDELFRQCMIIQ